MGVKDVGLFLGGGDGVVACGDSLVCVGGVCVFVVEASYEPPKFGGICVECDSFKKLFPFSVLFFTDIIGNFLV